MRLRRALATTVAAMSTALVLSSCGVFDNGGASADTSDTLRLGISRQLTSLDPGKSGSIDGDATVQGAIFNGLTRIDPNLDLVGDLAESWEQESETRWVFHLRQGVKFSNGDPFTSADAAWNFDRVLSDTSGFSNGASLAPVIAEVSTPDDHTLVIDTKGPYLDLADRLANFFLTQQAWTETHNPGLEPLGTGPYRLVSLDLENGATLERNPEYWGEQPDFDTVEYVVLSTEAARVSAAQTGSIDAAVQFEPANLEQFADSDVYDTGNQWSSWNMSLRFNETKAPLGDVRVRQGLNYAVDKATIASTLLGSDITPLEGQVLSGPYDKLNPALSAYPYDPERAKQLFAEAGFPNGFELELQLSTGTYIASDLVAEAIANQLAEVGVKVNITTAQFPAWVDRSRTDEVADLIYIGYTSGYKAPVERLRIYTSGYAQSHFEDPEYDNLISQLTAAPNEQERTRLFNEATSHFHANPHVLFLWPQPLTYVVSKDLDWTPRPEHWLLPQDFSLAE
ncbi:ABC transporter substrate-binding protein [Rhodococcus pyridinivorans]|uniref:ABC transporter substrate-binding protein n=1 Tax=Rhodococcus pyridinivorans TaxID=103816 RepID=UPI0020791DB5|nr:ABC transporter substrate-binding protein [Rhodococcus pyridinivorans]USI93005.1 ABC transporter substrate-binding protein [Rhodococcus pyridinivorans]